MYYGKIKAIDIANGIGCRTTIWVSGCDLHCKNCFNPETWDYNYGSLYTEETLLTLLNNVGKVFIHGLTILGGEPLAINNFPSVEDIVYNVKKRYPKKSIWLYTGFTWEELPKYVTKEFLNHIDVLIDGPYVDSLSSKDLVFKGSSNQRLIDVKNTLKQNKIIEIIYNRV